MVGFCELRNELPLYYIKTQVGLGGTGGAGTNNFTNFIGYYCQTISTHFKEL
jgi:hypothetical protein